MIEYINNLINQPWERSGLHCWRLVCQVQRDLFGRVLPVVFNSAPGRRLKSNTFENHPEREKWQESSEPQDGAIVLMQQGTSGTIHAGVYLDCEGGGVLHSDMQHGVVFDSLPQIHRARNWSTRFMVPR